MKKIVLLFVLILSIFSCRKDENSQNDHMVLIKGKIGNVSKGGEDFLSLSKERTLADAKKVVVFTGERYSVVNIENSSFAVDAQEGSAVALIFVDANNQYIGNLSVSGLNILPLVNLSDGDNTIIDLSTLTLFETSVVPANNPIGKEIMISDDDISMLKEIGSYFEAIAKNLDSDNDGILDYFNDKQVVINSEFIVDGGETGINNTPASLKDVSMLEPGYGVRISGRKQ